MVYSDDELLNSLTGKKQSFVNAEGIPFARPTEEEMTTEYAAKKLVSDISNKPIVKETKPAQVSAAPVIEKQIPQLPKKEVVAAKPIATPIEMPVLETAPEPEIREPKKSIAPVSQIEIPAIVEKSPQADTTPNDAPPSKADDNFDWKELLSQVLIAGAPLVADIASGGGYAAEAYGAGHKALGSYLDAKEKRDAEQAKRDFELQKIQAKTKAEKPVPVLNTDTQESTYARPVTLEDGSTVWRDMNTQKIINAAPIEKQYVEWTTEQTPKGLERVGLKQTGEVVRPGVMAPTMESKARPYGAQQKTIFNPQTGRDEIYIFDPNTKAYTPTGMLPGATPQVRKEPGTDEIVTVQPYTGRVTPVTGPGTAYGKGAAATVGAGRLSEQMLGALEKDKVYQEAKMALSNAKDAETLLDTNSPVTTEVFKRKMARLSSEVGVLTEQDVRSFGGSRALADRVTQIANEWINGTFTEKNRNYYKEIIGILKRSQQSKMNAEIARTEKIYSKRAPRAGAGAAEMLKESAGELYTNENKVTTQSIMEKLNRLQNR